MKTLFNLLFFSSLLMSLQSGALTFESTSLVDASETNYLSFFYPINDVGYAFETISADFNGDGFDDILSLGGRTSNFGNGGVTFAIPLALRLYNNGEYQFHNLGVTFTSPVVNVIDIDRDGDLDIVTLPGIILINDGAANFAVEQINSQWSAGNNVFTFDWDNDGDLDIITQKRIFLNNGQLDFNENFAAPEQLLQGAFSQIFHYSDINQDNRIDLLLAVGSKLQSWIKDEQGSLNLLSEVELGNSIMKIHGINKPNGVQNFILSTNLQGTESLYKLENDGEGHFSSVELDVDAQNIRADNIRFTKFFNVDLNNDGNMELVVSASYSDFLDCGNLQSLVYIFENNSDGDWQLKRKLHSEAYIYNSLFSFFSSGNTDMPTIIDLNGDQLPDIIQQGDETMVWLNQSREEGEFSFKLSNKSITQFNKNIDAIDFDNDGNLDIFMTAEYEHRCTSPDVIHTPENFITSKLWMNQGSNNFKPYASTFAGGNDFLRSYSYVKFADLENDDSPSMIVTSQNPLTHLKESFYLNPLVFEPLLATRLPEAIKYAEIVNIDETGENKEIVAIIDSEEAPIVIFALMNNTFIEVARIETGNGLSEFKLADMNQDGNIDIVINNKANQNGIKIWYNDGQRHFNQGVAFGETVQAIAIMDVNNDNKLDIIASNELHDIWLNQGQNVFNKLNYDDSFWHRPAGSTDNFQNIIASSLQAVDVNKDGRMDLIAKYNGSYLVYLNESSNEKLWFYSVFGVDAGIDRQITNVIINDINRDNRLDFISTDNTDVIINTQRDEKLITGLFYNPSKNGHGFSLDEIGYNNLYYSIFYSYDDSGNPEWYASLNRHYKYNSNEIKFEFISLYTRNLQNPIRYNYDYIKRKAVVNDAVEFKGRIDFQQQSHTDRINRVFVKIGETNDSWNILSILSEDKHPQNDLSGHWWAGENDSGWGVALNFQETNGVQTVVATLYFYDETGQPVWVIGTQEGFELNQNVTINMEKINGYGRSQNSVELTRVPAGTITINLSQASQNINEAGLLTMDIHYPSDSQNDNWVRETIPFGLLSKPRIP